MMTLFRVLETNASISRETVQLLPLPVVPTTAQWRPKTASNEMEHSIPLEAILPNEAHIVSLRYLFELDIMFCKKDIGQEYTFAPISGKREIVRSMSSGLVIENEKASSAFAMG